MSISVYQKPTSYNIVYTNPHQNLAPQELAKAANKNKLLFNNPSGELGFYDGGLLLDIETYPNVASFPATGEANKFYLDESENKMYRYAGSQYHYFPHDVYSKVEIDTNHYTKASVYTKAETDNKYVIRSGTNNDMTGSQINNLNTLSVSNALTANQTAISITKPVNLGWNDMNFVSKINNKIQVDGTNTDILSNVDMKNNNVIGTNNMNINSISAIDGTTAMNFTGGATPSIKLNQPIDCSNKLLHNVDLVKTTGIDTTWFRASDETNAFHVADKLYMYKNIDARNLEINEANKIRTDWIMGKAGGDHIQFTTGTTSQIDFHQRLQMNTRDILGIGTTNTTNINVTNIRALDTSPALAIGADIQLSKQIDMNSNNILEVGTMDSANTQTEMIRDRAGGAYIQITPGPTPQVDYHQRIHMNLRDIMAINTTNTTNINVTNINAIDGSQTMALGVDIQLSKQIDMNNNNIIEVGTIDAATTQTEMIRDRAGGAYIQITPGPTSQVDYHQRIQMNLRDIIGINAIESGAVRSIDGTPNMTLSATETTLNKTVNGNSQTINDVSVLEVSTVRSVDGTNSMILNPTTILMEKNVSGQNSVSLTNWVNVQTTNINSEPYQPMKQAFQTFTWATSGNETHTYNAPVGWEIVTATWTDDTSGLVWADQDGLSIIQKTNYTSIQTSLPAGTKMQVRVLLVKVV